MPVAVLPDGDARRVPGPNLFDDGPGVVVDSTWPATTPPATIAAHIAAWQDVATRACAGAGWTARGVDRVRARTDRTFVSVFVSAPPDMLDAALAIAEWSWVAAANPTPESWVRIAARLAAIPREPAVRVLLDAADARALPATHDDDGVSVGAGVGVRCWPRGAVPAPDAVDWAAITTVPIGLVTGSNGKTTVTRLAAAMLRADGHTVGTTTTDGVRIAGPGEATADVLEDGDWAGPGGARRVLRDPRITAAVLETARGGILRRGLAVRHATAAVVTNVAADHLGEYGIDTLDDVAEAKLVVVRALRDASATLIVPADDPVLARAAVTVARERPFAVCWTQTDLHDLAAAARLDAHVRAGGRAAVVRHDDGDETLAWCDGDTWHTLARVVDVPVTAGGRARHNVANALHAAALAFALGVSHDAVRTALTRFGAGARDNPGRLERFTVGGVTVVVDYAHNPDGLDALHAATRSLAGTRRLILVGQAGDRDDAALAALAAAAWAGGAVDRVIVKELPSMLRGRSAGEVPTRLRAGLLAAGAPSSAIGGAPDEWGGVQAALTWARPGDVLLLPLHEVRESVVAWLDQLAATGWRAGDPLPRGATPDG